MVGRRQKNNESDLKKLMRQVAEAEGMTMSEIARRWQKSPSNLSDRLTRGSISYEELKELAGILGVEMKITLTDPQKMTSWTR